MTSSKACSAPPTWIGCGGRPYLKAAGREDAAQIRDYPVRVSDIDIFDHMNNSVYWSVIEDYLFS